MAPDDQYSDSDQTRMVEVGAEILLESMKHSNYATQCHAI